MNQHTPAQLKAIQTWTEQRDSLLREIGVLTTQYQELEKNTKASAEAFSALEKQIENSRGRITELAALEQRHKNSLSNEVAELEVRKSRLETECAAFEKSIKASEIEQGRIVTSITALCEAHDKMADQAQIVKGVVGDIITLSENNASETKTLMSEVRTIAVEVIEKGNTNLTQTNIVLEKLPKYIFELQRPIPVRRTYHAPRGTAIEADKPQK